MVVSVPAVSADTTTTTGGFLPTQSHHHHHSLSGFRPHSRVSFSFAPKPKLRLFSKTPSSRTVSVKAQLNKVVVDGSKNDAAVPETKSGIPAQEKKNDEPSTESSARQLPSEESISQFMSQVAGLVKLVDSRDIAELQLKQRDCEIIIRKKEAIEQTQSPVPVAMMQSSPAMASPPASAPPPPTHLPALPPPAAPAVSSSKPSLPLLKSPMAGTFYRSPAPSEPPFVKVGDKVQKGQVICIIEAMKLMNELESELSGTVVEVVAEDGKPISIDTPLFVIQP